jgi:hypothetical protein
MIECYKCELSHVMKGHAKFVLCCDRFRDLTDLDHQVIECSEYKERPEIDW